jgi:hypothetical protein
MVCGLAPVPILPHRFGSNILAGGRGAAMSPPHEKLGRTPISFRSLLALSVGSRARGLYRL